MTEETYIWMDWEKVTWKTWNPYTVDDFPCHLCREEIATIKVKYKKKGVIITGMVCDKCFKNHYE